MKTRLFQLFASLALASSLAPQALAGERFYISYNPQRAEWTVRVNEARKRYNLFIEGKLAAYSRNSGIGEGHAPFLAEPRQYPVRSIWRDPTLRPGDIYASASGFLIFQGEIGRRHAMTDFIGLSRSKALARGLALANTRDAATHGNAGTFFKTAAR